MEFILQMFDLEPILATLSVPVTSYLTGGSREDLLWLAFGGDAASQDRE